MSSGAADRAAPVTEQDAALYSVSITERPKSARYALSFAQTRMFDYWLRQKWVMNSTA